MSSHLSDIAQTGDLRRRIEELEHEVQSLTEELDELTSHEDESLQAALDQGSRLFKTNLTYEAEILRLQQRNAELALQLQITREAFGREKPFVSTKLDDAAVQVDLKNEPATFRDATTQTQEIRIASNEWVVLDADDTYQLESDESEHVPKHVLSFDNGKLNDSEGLPEPQECSDINLDDDTNGSEIPTTISNLVKYPDDALNNQIANSWLPAAFDYVNVDLGPKFKAVVTAWISLERTSHWLTDRYERLPSVARPRLLAKWVDNKRYLKEGNEPDIAQECGDQFGEEVKNWWIALQPERKRSGVTADFDAGQDWKSLNKYGLNGWFGIIVCLKWWGMNLQSRAVESGRGSSEDDWLDMVEEVHGMMEALVEYRTLLLR